MAEITPSDFFPNYHLGVNPYAVQSTSSACVTETGPGKQLKSCPPTCYVCGIAATGHHYDVPSCNGCKTFFRRSLISEKQYDCKRIGKCYDNISDCKPLKCRACRLKKCIDVGMNPLAMKLEEELTSNETIKEVVRKRQNSSTEVLPVIKVLPSTIDGRVCGVIDNLIYLEFKMDQYRQSSYNPRPDEIPRLHDILTDCSRIDSVTSMGPMQGWPLVIEKRLGPPTGPPPYLATRKFWMVYDMISTIEYAKTFWFMYQLNLEDKQMLLKNVVLNCQNLNVAFFSMASKSDSMLFPDGTSPPVDDEEKKARHSSNEVFLYQRKIIGTLIRSNMDRVSYVLLKALCLCNAAVSGLSINAQKLLAIEKDKYCLALFKHCMNTFGTNHGPDRFTAILGIVDLLEHTQKIQKDIHVLMTLSREKWIKRTVFNDIME